MKPTLWLKIISLLATAGTFAFPCVVKAQSDNFDDGNDTANPAWTRYDPIGDFTGIPNGSWTFPGANSYRLQAFFSPDPVTYGPGRIASTLSNVYSDFYAAVDVVDWNDTFNQAFGILARLGNVGPGTTTGYSLTYQEIDHHLSISRITGEAATDLPGTSVAITLAKTSDYRFVFTGQGTNFEGRIYQLPDTFNPILVIDGADSTYASGIGGLLVYDNSAGGNASADATFDNYVAAVHKPASLTSVIMVNSITNNGAAKNSIGVRFDRPMLPSSVTDPTRYVVNLGSVNVTNIILRPDGRSVELMLGSAVGEFFSVCVTNVLDAASNSITAIATGFMSQYASTTIGTPGDPPQPGQVYTAFWDSFDVTSGGSDIGGTSDHFHFVYQPVVGDFDMRVRVTQLDVVDPNSKAGLMARESLAPNSPTLQTYFTPPQGANTIEATVRPTFGSDTLGFEIQPLASANPLRWLRITRTNDNFTTYFSDNGEDWTISGVRTQQFQTTLFVGMAVSSHNPVAATTGAFTDFYVRGGKPGDQVRPQLSVVRNGPNITVTWPRTPQDFAVQVATNLNGSQESTNLPEWGFLVIPIHLVQSSGSNGGSWQIDIPINFFGSQLFLRASRVSRLIPDIPGIMVTTGIILSPDSGLTVSSTSGTLCNPATVIANTAFAQTGSYVVFSNPLSPTAAVDTLQSGASVDTVLQVKNKTSLTTDCNDDASPSITSRVTGLPGATASRTKYTFVTGAKTGSSPASVIQVYLTY